MSTLPELKNQLSAELKKPKKERNRELIATLHAGIKSQKDLLKKEFKKNSKENHKIEVQTRLSLYTKRNKVYGKLREQKKKDNARDNKK